MEKLMLFLKAIAWIFGVISTILFIVILYLNMTYPGSVDELRDRMMGKTRTYKHGDIWFIAMIICWVFIYVF